jgi:hypothetical protein
LWTLSQPTPLQAVSSASQRALRASTHQPFSHVGLCALTLGISIIEAFIENVKIMAIEIASISFLDVFVFYFLL